jgi:peptidoglycan/xylan/chitin deacetylase (PgdA/CDA1 family)
MIRSLVLKVPLALALGVALWLGPGSAAGLAALAVAGLFAALLAWQVFDVNAGLWVPTLWRAASPGGAVALTFDDGPDPEFTPRVLDILRSKGVPATFFVVGSRVRTRPDILAQIDAAGHLVGNHTDTHGAGFHFHLWAAIRKELAACNLAVRSTIGKEPAFFRSPQGFKNPALGDVVREMGFSAIGWQVRGFDSVEPDADKIVRRIVSRVRPGGIVQMHDGSSAFGPKGRKATLDALPRVIDAIRAAGLTFVPLDSLLGRAAYHAAPTDQSSRGPISSPDRTKKASP